MSFLCPECSRRSLVIAKKLELPADSRSDEIALQIVDCAQCGFTSAAIFEESRRGASESFEHVGHRVGREDLIWLKRLIQECPEVGNSRCDCGSHRILAKKTAAGRIELEKRFTSLGTFAISL